MRCCLLVVLLSFGSCARPAASDLWLLDAGRGASVQLDDELEIAAWQPSEAARCLAPGAEGLWLARASVPGAALDCLWLAPFRPAGADRPAPRELRFVALAALAPDGRGGVYALDRGDGGRGRVWRVEPWLERRFLTELPEACTLARVGDELCVGSERGTLWRLRRDGAVLFEVELGAPLCALAPGAEEGELYALTGGSTPRLSALSRTLGTRWSVGLDQPTNSLALEPEGESAWVVEGTTLVAFEPGGRRACALELPERGGPWRAFAASKGRVWLAGTGAVLRIESVAGRAWIAASQGGFGALCAAVRAPGLVPLSAR